MRVSVITVCRNAANVIRGAFQSVCTQSYPHIEYIVVDGASTDATCRIAEEFSDCIDVFVSERDRGIYNAMNKAVALASGDVLYFLNADDRFHDENVVSDIVTRFEDGQSDILYGNVELLLPGQAPVPILYPDILTRRFFGRRTICHQAFFARHSVFDTVGGFDESYFLVADYLWLLKSYFDHDLRFVHVDRMIARVDGTGTSYRSDRLEEERIRAMAKYFSAFEIKMWRTWPLHLAHVLDRMRWYAKRATGWQGHGRGSS